MSQKKRILILCIFCLIILSLVFGLMSCRVNKKETEPKTLVIYNYTKEKQIAKLKCYRIEADDNDEYLEIYAYVDKNIYKYYLIYKKGDNIGYTYK